MITDTTHATIAALARLANPRSRAVRGYHLAASGGSVRRYTCTACGCLIDTESARYRPTVHAARAVDTHLAAHFATAQ